jgi:hypothetical protein
MDIGIGSLKLKFIREPDGSGAVFGEPVIRPELRDEGSLLSPEPETARLPLFAVQQT